MKIIKTAAYEKTALLGLGKRPQFDLSLDTQPLVVSPQRLQDFCNRHGNKAIPVLNELFGFQLQKQYRGGLGSALRNWWTNAVGFNRRQRELAQKRQVNPERNKPDSMPPAAPPPPNLGAANS